MSWRQRYLLLALAVARLFPGRAIRLPFFRRGMTCRVTVWDDKHPYVEPDDGEVGP